MKFYRRPEPRQEAGARPLLRRSRFTQAHGRTADGGPVTPPFTFQAAATPKVLVEELGASAGPLFCYHSTVVNTTVLCGTAKHGFNVVTTADPLNTTPKISMVGIKLDVVSKSGTRRVTVIHRALVRMRTVENTVK